MNTAHEQAEGSALGMFEWVHEPIMVPIQTFSQPTHAFFYQPPLEIPPTAMTDMPSPGYLRSTHSPCDCTP